MLSEKRDIKWFDGEERLVGSEEICWLLLVD